MKALILAAGQGDRLEHLTKEKPKALVCLAGKELISYQLSFLDHATFEKIGVVVGYRAEILKNFLKRNGNVLVMENKSFHLGSILSIEAALAFLDEAFLLMNVDHIYPEKLIPLLAKASQGQNITAFCDFDRKLLEDDMKISRYTNGLLKEIDKKLQVYDGGYIGITFCPKAKLEVYKEALRKTLAEFGPKTNVEGILKNLAAEKEPITIADTSGIRWLEIDTLHDLKQAQAKLHDKNHL